MEGQEYQTMPGYATSLSPYFCPKIGLSLGKFCTGAVLKFAQKLAHRFLAEGRFGIFQWQPFHYHLEAP
jgi:hypothetical protein